MDKMTMSRVLGSIVLLALAAVSHGAGPDKINTDKAQAAARGGNAAFLRGDLDEAIRCYAEAIRLDQGDATARNNRAYAWLSKGDADRAIADYNEALRLDPKFAKAHFFRGSAYEDKDDWNKAVADYTAAIRLDPTYARAYCSRGNTAKTPPLFDDGRGQSMSLAKSAVPGTSFFVAPGGDDRNPGTIERPFATLYKALEWVRPGDTVNLRGGTYQAMVNWNKSGTPGAPITIRSYHNEDVTLQSSEQLSWTYVSDPYFGDCWKAAIPYRRIQYSGLQHAIWEDAVTAAGNPRIGISAIVKGGYPCAAMHAATDFARPQAAAGRPLTDKSGKLKYDITWYDRESKTLWFKPGPSAVTNPDRQLYVISTSCGQFSVGGSYVRFSGLKFEYLSFFHQQGNPIGCDISNCEIKHCGGGICGGGRRCSYTSLFIDKVGDWLVWRNGGYDEAYLSHCFYFNGTRCVVANCFFGRSNKGGPIQNYPDGVTENLFDGNILYHSDGGSIFMGTGRNCITNNISLQTGHGMGPYVAMRGFTFAHNYSEAAYPLDFAAQEANGNYSETFEKFSVNGNVLNNTGGCVDYRGNMVDARQCRIDDNVYLGSRHWRLGLTQAVPPAAKHHDYTTFASYAAALQAMPHCAAWEKGSKAVAAAPRFDFAVMDAYLDSEPPLASVFVKIRSYVKGLTAPFAGEGPAIDTSVTGG